MITAAVTASEYQEEESESLQYLIPSLSESERNYFLLRILKGESHIGEYGTAARDASYS
ncbi:MAG: hypothetical protein QNJ47_18380 [Nostocaceae cyanobacterium]|nr:hypothetical protein [Nostocaceae cyanobacterium]